ncbi:unnamed protein product [Linum tenue]|uniref:Uncharacterized protein n=1 Tax=Linum tenue TaxID=586396 RepID=A0AAV0PVT1_9ROSI|nr:unnamed protein product [Linum tenue]
MKHSTKAPNNSLPRFSTLSGEPPGIWVSTIHLLPLRVRRYPTSRHCSDPGPRNGIGGHLPSLFRSKSLQTI